MREHETDWPQLFLEQVRDERRRTRHDRHTLERPDRVTDIEQHGGYCARDIHHEGLAGRLGQQPLDELRGLDVAADRARFGRHLEQAKRAWIATAMQRMTVARDRLALRAQDG